MLFLVTSFCRRGSTDTTQTQLSREGIMEGLWTLRLLLIASLSKPYNKSSFFSHKQAQ